MKALKAVFATVCLAFAGIADVQGQPTLEKCDEVLAGAPDQRRSYNCFFYAFRAPWALRGSDREAAARSRPHAGSSRRPPQPRPHRGRPWPRAGGGAVPAIDRGLCACRGAGRAHLGADGPDLLPRRAGASRRSGRDPGARAPGRRRKSATITCSRRPPSSAGVQAENRADYGRALRYYREAELVAFPDGDIGAKADTLGGLGRMSSALGRPEEAMAYFTREAELLSGTPALHNREAGDPLQHRQRGRGR